MSVASTDIVIYGAANIAEDNVSTQGGAINTAIRYIFDTNSLVTSPASSGGTGALTAVSDNAADTMNITVTGRNVAGSIVSQTKALTGATVIDLNSGTFERILKVTLASSAAGTVTLADDANGPGIIGNTIVDIETGVTEVRRPFYNVASDVSGGSSRDFYEKVFIKNNNGTNSLLSMTIAEAAGGLASSITFDVEDAVDDNNSTASRLNTVPTGMNGSFDSNDKSIPGTDLAAGSAIGVWLKLTLAAGASAANSTYQLDVSGSTT